jgi:hypothetical protein
MDTRCRTALWSIANDIDTGNFCRRFVDREGDAAMSKLRQSWREMLVLPRKILMHEQNIHGLSR